MKKKFAQYAFYPLMLAGSLGLFLVGHPYFTGAPLFMLVSLVNLFASLVVHALEKIFPYRKDWNVSRGDRMANLILTTVVLPALALATQALLGYLAQDVLPGIHQFFSSLWPHQAPIALQFVLATSICEFFFYWTHRWGHRIEFLWAFHRAHHSVERVYWENSGRFHPVDLFLNWFFYFMPMALCGVSSEVIALFILFNGVTGMLEHANINYRAGLLNRVFNTAELHRWHHSTVIPESSTNFGKILCVWDQVFNSYFLPADAQVKDVGVLDDHAHLTGFWAEFTHPFRMVSEHIRKIIIWILILAGSIFGTSHANAVGKKSVPNYIDNTCVVDAVDPYEPHIRIDSGEYKNLCVNPTLRRSAQRLSLEDAQKYFPGTKDLVVSNFSHLDQFWIAEIPASKIDGILLQVEYFPMALGIEIAHTQFRIHFANGAKIRLKPQSPKQKTQAEQTLDGLIFSVENISPYGELFDPIKGLFDQYRTAYRLISLEQKYDWMIRQQHHRVEQYVFKFDETQAQAIFNEGLRRGTENSIGLAYNTLKHSCVTELFAIVDKVFGAAPRSQPFNPNSAPKEFYQRGYLYTDKPTRSFNDEQQFR